MFSHRERSHQVECQVLPRTIRQSCSMQGLWFGLWRHNLIRVMLWLTPPPHQSLATRPFGQWTLCLYYILMSSCTRSTTHFLSDLGITIRFWCRTIFPTSQYLYFWGHFVWSPLFRNCRSDFSSGSDSRSISRAIMVFSCHEVDVPVCNCGFLA